MTGVILGLLIQLLVLSKTNRNMTVTSETHCRELAQLKCTELEWECRIRQYKYAIEHRLGDRAEQQRELTNCYLKKFEVQVEISDFEMKFKN